MRTRKANGTEGPQESELFQQNEDTAPYSSPTAQSSPKKRGPQNTRNARSVSSAPSHRGTPAERARERKLRDDAMALVHNPQLVQCYRCGSKIKLSLKSFWDPFHWIKHKERCLKKPESVVQEMRESSDLPLPPPKSPTPPPAPVLSVPAVPVAPKSSWPTEVKVYVKRTSPSPSLTPPLVSDEEEDEEEDQSIAAGPSHSPEVFVAPIPSRPHPYSNLTASYPSSHDNCDRDYLYRSSPPTQGQAPARRGTLTLAHKPYFAPVFYEEDRCCSPPLTMLGFKESRVRLSRH